MSLAERKPRAPPHSANSLEMTPDPVSSLVSSLASFRAAAEIKAWALESKLFFEIRLPLLERFSLLLALLLHHGQRLLLLLSLFLLLFHQ